MKKIRMENVNLENELIEHGLYGYYLNECDPWILEKFNAVDKILWKMEYLNSDNINIINDINYINKLENPTPNDLEDLKELKQELVLNNKDLVIWADKYIELIYLLKDFRQQLGPIHQFENFNFIIHDKKYNKLNWMVYDSVLLLKSNNTAIKIFKCGLIAIYKGTNFLILENLDTLENLDQILMEEL